MSIRIMSMVWQHYPRGGSEKLALLALADWCDDHGGTLYPSIAAIAKKICVSDAQARRIVHGFIDAGLLEVVGNHNGGSKTQTRRYRLKLQKLCARAGDDVSPVIRATPCTDAPDALHGCASPLAPMLANPSLNIKEPPLLRKSANGSGFRNSEDKDEIKFTENFEDRFVEAEDEDDEDKFMVDIEDISLKDFDRYFDEDLESRLKENTEDDFESEFERKPKTNPKSESAENPISTKANKSWQTGFEAFWSAYPNKKSKGHAENAWKALKPDQALVDRVLKAIESAKTSDGWCKDGGRYIPHPATWLRGKRWLDEDGGGAGGGSEKAIPIWDL